MEYHIAVKLKSGEEKEGIKRLFELHQNNKEVILEHIYIPFLQGEKFLIENILVKEDEILSLEIFMTDLEERIELKKISQGSTDKERDEILNNLNSNESITDITRSIYEDAKKILKNRKEKEKNKDKEKKEKERKNKSSNDFQKQSSSRNRNNRDRDFRSRDRDDDSRNNRGRGDYRR